MIRNIKAYLFLFGFCILVFSMACSNVQAGNVGPEDEVGLCIEETKVISIFKRCAPSVVFITSKDRYRSMFSMRIHEVEQGSGSGFVWDRQGHIVTNYHVIKDPNSRVIREADAVEVTMADGTTLDARVVGTAPEKDLAVLKVDYPADRLKPVDIGTSRSLQVGQTVLAIGNPFGLDHTLTKGIVSAKGREIKSMVGRIIRDVIQTDAAINPGNSGGPLIDSGGRLVGVNTAIVSPTGFNSGIGFAVPVDTVKRIVPQLIRFGKAITPDPGVVLVQDKYLRRLTDRGLVILEVVDKTPAAAKGLEGIYSNRRGEPVMGDVILAVDGKPVNNSYEYLDILERFEPGDEVVFKIQRGREVFDVEIPLVLIRYQ